MSETPPPASAPLTPLSRTVDEIVERIKELGKDKSHDPDGVERSRLLESLPWEHAKQFLREDAPQTEETWEENRCASIEQIQAAMIGYAAFAWDKANSCRGTSALRTLSHFRGLLWLLGDKGEAIINEAFPDRGEPAAWFGKKALVAVCDYLDTINPEVSVKWRKFDNDEWVDYDDSAPTGLTEPVSANEALGIDG